MRAKCAVFALAAIFPLTLTPASADVKYEYDDHGRLKRMVTETGAVIDYVYDDAGNRSTVTAHGTPAFSVNNASASEGSALSFSVTRTGAAATAQNVNYATANGTASAGSDYTATSGTLYFLAGQNSKTVTVSTTQDTAVESNETLYLNLSNATGGATIADSQGVGTINDDDTITYVRNSAGTIQSGFVEYWEWEEIWPDYEVEWYWTDTTGTGWVHHSLGGGYCDQNGTLNTGYSWTGNGCELRVD